MTRRRRSSAREFVAESHRIAQSNAADKEDSALPSFLIGLAQHDSSVDYELITSDAYGARFREVAVDSL